MNVNREYEDYKNKLRIGYWNYCDKYSISSNMFMQPENRDERAPIFINEKRNKNILKNEDTAKDMNDLTHSISKHIYFGNMNSSQAIAINIFGNLKYLDKLHLLEKLKCDDGITPLFIKTTPIICKFEHKPKNLSEQKQPTSVDVFFDGDYRIAVECKFTENIVGKCKQAEKKICDGNYNPCILTKKKAKYWDYIPSVFDWKTEELIGKTCPFNETYQLVRNILAVTVNGDIVEPDKAHVVMVYDERNPHFKCGGRGMKSWCTTKNALKTECKNILQKCSWQQIIEAITVDRDLNWLVKELEEKYGLLSCEK